MAMDGLDAEIRALKPVTDFSRRGFMTTSLIAGFTLATGPVNAQNVISTDSSGLTAGEVKIPARDGQLPGYRAMPASGSNFPVALVCQEIFGVHEHIKDVCRRFAKAGYYAIAPEIYAREADMTKVTTLDGARAVAAKISDESVMSDFDAAARFAQSEKADAAKLGITGFCYGGRIVWLYAAHNPQLKAGVAWYGRITGTPSELTPRHPIELAKALKAPVLGLYGSADQGIPVEDVEKMRAALKAADTKAAEASELVVYDGAPHGFHADYRPSYRADAAKDGWQRLQAWFKEHGVA
jgi:carboxymethylenebutenolidase